MTDNPMVSGLAQLEKKQAELDRLESQAREIAEERLLANMDVFTDWLAGHCYQIDQVPQRAIPQCPAALQEMIDGMKVPELLAASLHPFARVRSVATLELIRRYVAENETLMGMFTEDAMEGLQ
jgi:hypothetical protein